MLLNLQQRLECRPYVLERLQGLDQGPRPSTLPTRPRPRPRPPVTRPRPRPRPQVSRPRPRPRPQKIGLKAGPRPRPRPRPNITVLLCWIKAFCHGCKSLFKTGGAKNFFFNLAPPFISEPLNLTLIGGA